MNQPIQNSAFVSHRPWRLSWDALLFILFWASLLWSSEAAGMVPALKQNNVSLIVHLTRIFDNDPVPGLLLIVLMLYLGADLWLSGRSQFTIKLSAVWILIITFVIIPTLLAIEDRHSGVSYLYIHDGAIQIEEATKFLIAGKNPYVEDYVATPMAQWPFFDAGLSVNPALYHFIYLPFLPIMSAPAYLLSQAILGWFDERFIYLLLLVASVLLVLSLKQSPRARLAALMILTLNPLFVPFFIEGRNDIVVSCSLLGAVLFLQRGRVAWAAILIAIAATTKQTIWFLIPFLVLYALRLDRVSNGWKYIISRSRALVPGVILLVAIVLPFLVWNAGAFVDDIINYQAGSSTTGMNYPIKSEGLGGLGLGLGWIQSDTDSYPFSAFQIGVGGLLLAILLWRQWRHNTLSQMVMNYALLFFVFGFLSRVFNDNHLGFALTWLILPSFIGEEGALDATLSNMDY